MQADLQRLSQRMRVFWMQFAGKGLILSVVRGTLKGIGQEIWTASSAVCARWNGFRNSQQHLAIAAVGIVTVKALSLGRRSMQPQRLGPFMTRKANPLLRRRQADRCHVALRLRHMANSARTHHCRMHGFSGQLAGVTRRTRGVSDAPRMLHRKHRKSTDK